MKHFFSILFLLLFSIAGHAAQEMCWIKPIPTALLSDKFCSAEGYVHNLTYKPSTGDLRFQLTEDSAGTSVISTSVSGSSQSLWIDAGKNSGVLGSIILGSMALSAQNNKKMILVTYEKNLSDSTSISLISVKLF